jgi:nitrate reductase NapAB chaperone NapD
MELITFEEILSALTSSEKEQLKDVIKILNEIRNCNIYKILKYAIIFILN